MAVTVGVIWADGVIQSPRQQGVQNRDEGPAGLGELVVETWRRGLVGSPADNPGVLECLEPGRDAVPGRARPVDDVGEAGAAQRQLADDQQRPPLADHVERRGDRTWPTRQV